MANNGTSSSQIAKNPGGIKSVQASGLLVGKKEITAYLNISSDTFAVFIGLGMPTIVSNNRYYAHKDNLELWFQAITRQQARQMEVDAE